MINSIRAAWTWFIDGLVQAWTTVEDRIWPRDRLALVRTGDGYAIQHADGRFETTRLQLQNSESGAALVPAEAAALIKDHEVDLILPADELLIRTLDPLPGASRPYLDGIVRHQLERIAPWRTSDVLYTYQTAPAGPEDSRLIVTVAATARSLHRQILSALSALDPRNVQLLYRNVPQAGGDVAIAAAENSSLVPRTQRLRRALAWGTAAFALAGLAGIALLTVTWYQTATALETVEKDVSDLRSKLVAAGQTVPTGDRDVEAIFARRRSTPFAILAIEALSNALPDDTWLTELRISEGRARMSGVSHAVSALVPVLQASAAFSEATFFAPTTRLPDGQGDRFHLEARLETGDEKKP